MQNLNYIDDDIDAVNQMAADIHAKPDSRRTSSATLICDYSENDLAKLLISAEEGSPLKYEQSPDSRQHSSGNKYEETGSGQKL